MTLRLPLFGRILVWLALNLILLAGAIGVIFVAEFRIEPLLLGLVGERAQRAADALMAEMRDRDPTGWKDALARFTAVYSVPAMLVREDGLVMAGPAMAVPGEVLAKLRPSGAGPGPGEPPRGGGRRGPRPEFDGAPDGDGFGPPHEGFHRPPPAPRAFVRAGTPARYWLVAGGLVFGPDERRPSRVVLVSDSLSGSGLFFDIRPWLWAGSGVLLLSVLWWLPFVGGITRSISQMSRVTERIAEGQFDATVTDDRGDEIGRLGGAINRMASRLEGYVNGQKRFLGDIAHELCSPLARMEMALGVLEQRADARQRDYVDDVREEVRHMSGLVNELLQFSKAGLKGKELPLRTIPLTELVARVIDREAPGEESVRSGLPDGLRVLGEPELLARALGNLLRNALRHAAGTGPIDITAEADASGEVRLVVTDSGPGVPPEALGRLGEPFFRPDLARSRETGGTGLGLAIVKTCVEACQGRLEIRNGAGRGLVATLVLRSADASAKA